MKKLTYRNRYKIPVVIFTLVLLMFMLFPFFVMLSTMFKSSAEVYQKPPYWIPKEFQFNNFVKVWTEYNLLGYFKNSIIIGLGTTLLNTLIIIPASYAIARFRFQGRSVVLYTLLAMQMFSPVIIIISLFKIFVKLHLLDSLFGLVLANTVITLSFTTWLMFGYFSSIPREIEDAARIDGCNRIGTLIRIMIPIAAPGLVTAMIYTFIQAWNDFLFPLSFINAQKKMPLTLGIYQFVGRWSTQWEMLNVATFLALIPVLILFFLIEKQLVAGLAGGAVKG
ncbi:MAG: carbohydrate ABC transporter permease [Peptostreptococcaceae bacterium]|nr:carbohydrate ABC transporter permease [Peptostreptococcaceae bacterium]